MTQKAGRKRKRDEATKQRTLWMTDTAWNNLDATAKAQNTSRSELIERFGRGETRAKLSRLIVAIDLIPRDPDSWDKETKEAISYGLADLLKLAIELREELPGNESPLT